jgi:hypothetical protein
VEAQQWFWRWGRMESFHAGNYYQSKAICRLVLLVFALLLEWKWRLSSGSSGRGHGWKAFAPVIIYPSKVICRLMLVFVLLE